MLGDFANDDKSRDFLCEIFEDTIERVERWDWEEAFDGCTALALIELARDGQVHACMHAHMHHM